VPIIPALRRLRQEDLEFKASLGYTAKPCLKKKVKNILTSCLTEKRWQVRFGHEP
jgi:hypothetical protein